MEKFNDFVKRHLFVEGVVCGVIACVWIYGTFIKEGYEQVKIKKELLEQDCAKKQAFEEKFYQGQIENHSLSAKVGDLQLQLADEERKFSNLRDGRWEEKYNSEKLAKISAEEQLASAQGRLAGLNSERDQTVKDYDTLKDKLSATERERDALKQLYQGGNRKSDPETNVKVQPSQTPGLDSAAALASLNGISIVDRGNFVISIASKIQGGIPPDVFIQMLALVSVTDRGAVVKSVAKYVTRPIAADQMSAISRSVSVVDSGEAMKALVQ